MCVCVCLSLVILALVCAVHVTSPGHGLSRSYWAKELIVKSFWCVRPCLSLLLLLLYAGQIRQVSLSGSLWFHRATSLFLFTALVDVTERPIWLLSDSYVIVCISFACYSFVPSHLLQASLWVTLVSSPHVSSMRVDCKVNFVLSCVSLSLVILLFPLSYLK